MDIFGKILSYNLLGFALYSTILTLVGVPIFIAVFTFIHAIGGGIGYLAFSNGKSEESTQDKDDKKDNENTQNDSDNSFAYGCLGTMIVLLLIGFSICGGF